MDLAKEGPQAPSGTIQTWRCVTGDGEITGHNLRRLLQVIRLTHGDWMVWDRIAWRVIVANVIRCDHVLRKTTKTVAVMYDVH